MNAFVFVGYVLKITAMIPDNVAVINIIRIKFVFGLADDKREDIFLKIIIDVFHSHRLTAFIKDHRTAANAIIRLIH